DEGGFDEFEEYLASRASRAATRACSRAFSLISAAISACAHGGSVARSASEMGGSGVSMTRNPPDPPAHDQARSARGERIQDGVSAHPAAVVGAGGSRGGGVDFRGEVPCHILLDTGYRIIGCGSNRSSG